MGIRKSLMHFSAVLLANSDFEGKVSGIARGFSVPQPRNSKLSGSQVVFPTASSFMAQSRQAINDALRPVLKRHSVPFAVLHGSVAAGQATPISDVDVAVYVDDQDCFLTVVAELDEAVPDRRVDVMNLARQPALIYYRVLATGDVIHLADEELYQDEKFRVMREYLDFKPTHDRILQDMERRLDDGAYGRTIE